jgi:hypothetical protein
MTARSDRHPRAGNLRLLVTLLGLCLVSACVGPAVTPALPAPELQLLGAAELAMPRGCEASPGAVYRTHFNVQPDGRVSDPASESGDGCVQQALRTWVTTFSYAPLRESTPVAFDWMVVTAARNN